MKMGMSGKKLGHKGSHLGFTVQKAQLSDSRAIMSFLFSKGFIFMVANVRDCVVKSKTQNFCAEGLYLLQYSVFNSFFFSRHC